MRTFINDAVFYSNSIFSFLEDELGNWEKNPHQCITTIKSRRTGKSQVQRFTLFIRSPQILLAWLKPKGEVVRWGEGSATGVGL